MFLDEDEDGEVELDLVEVVVVDEALVEVVFLSFLAVVVVVVLEEEVMVFLAISAS